MKHNLYKSWDSFFKSASALTNYEKGLMFERLTVHLLKTHPLYASSVDKVWLLRDCVPSTLKTKLNLPNTDEGIDIIAETFSGAYWAIQCKFKSSKEPPTMRELSTFNNLAHTHCKNISMAILFHTGERGVRKKHLMGEKYTEVGLEFWLGLTPQDWKRISDTSQSKGSKPQVRKPREHQNNAIKEAQKHFISNSESRGRLIMPCGTGKSLTAFWIAKSLKAKSVIVAVPSLNLIKQSLEDWTAEFVALNENPRPEWHVICSDDSTSKLQDEFVSDVYSLGIPTTTKIEDITSFLKRKTKGRKIIFTTYQSSDRLAEASRKAKFSFDLAILDEAHKTVGVKSKSFATLLSDTNISIKKRMFMTATERVLKGTNDDVLSMDDELVYGKRFYQLTFKEAIHSSPQIISDYKILTIAVTNKQIQEIVQKNKLLSDRKNKIEEQDAQSLAAAIALRQATKKYGIRHAISFHKSIKAAESFTNLNLRLNSSKVDKIDLTSYHISSKKSAGQRSQLLDDFKSDKLALMTNARCLTEGVNVPTIDCVLFADPKQSIVDIVQAAGRALRVSPGKKYGYIMMPLIVPDEMELEEFTETTPFKQIARIVTALSTQDERIVEEFRMKDQGKIVSDRRVEISGSIPNGLKFDISSFSESIETKYWEKVGRVNWRSFEDAREYVRSVQLRTIYDWRNYINAPNFPKDIPKAPDHYYKSQGWISFNDWLGAKQYCSFEDGRLFARSLKIKSAKEWNELYKLGKIPSNIPLSPNSVYSNTGWKSWGDWLGSKYVANQQRLYRDYQSAKFFVSKLGLKSVSEWKDYCKSGKKPTDIPNNPDQYYRDKGWNGYGDWLGTGTIAPHKSTFRSFIEARQFARSLKLKSSTEWFEFSKSSLRPKDIPGNPSKIYKNDGWKGFGDFLGTNTVSNSDKKFYSFIKAKAYIKQFKLKTLANWQKYSKSKRPSFIPSHPDQTYKNKGWKGWPDFLGKN